MKEAIRLAREQYGLNSVEIVNRNVFIVRRETQIVGAFGGGVEAVDGKSLSFIVVRTDGIKSSLVQLGIFVLGYGGENPCYTQEEFLKGTT
jgi:hypothetical protein